MLVFRFLIRRNNLVLGIIQYQNILVGLFDEPLSFYYCFLLLVSELDSILQALKPEVYYFDMLCRI